jgi:hypothetical protein
MADKDVYSRKKSTVRRAKLKRMAVHNNTDHDGPSWNFMYCAVLVRMESTVVEMKDSLFEPVLERWDYTRVERFKFDCTKIVK